MTTTVDALTGRPQKLHRGVALGIAAIIVVGGVSAAVAVAADNNGSSPAPVHLSHTPFVDQPLLKVSGPR